MIKIVVTSERRYKLVAGKWLDFLQINKTDFKGLFIFNHVAMAMAHTSV